MGHDSPSREVTNTIQPDVQLPSSLTADILILVFEELTVDLKSLCNVGLTCRTWRSLSLPSLLRHVNLTCHNNGRLPEKECELLPIIYADYDDKYRPFNLIRRQRAFTRLMLDRSGLAKYVKWLTWTLVWKDFNDSEPNEIDRQTWNVFSKLANVTKLDLASLHQIADADVVRENPSQLFQSVCDLRLLGWMHRGLARSIIESIDKRKLCSLNLDYLQDEGALPNGAPMDFETNEKYAQTLDWGMSSMDTDITVIDNDLYQRQESGTACIWPGLMSLPFRMLTAYSLQSLSQFEVRMPHFDWHVDTRNYVTFVQQSIKFIAHIRETIKSLVVVFGECPYLYAEYRDRPNLCGTWRTHMKGWYRGWCIKICGSFLKQLVCTLNNNAFPKLRSIRCEGFRFLETATAHEHETGGLDELFEKVRQCRFEDATFTKISSIDNREVFKGFDCEPKMEGFNTALLTES